MNLFKGLKARAIIGKNGKSLNAKQEEVEIENEAEENVPEIQSRGQNIRETYSYRNQDVEQTYSQRNSENNTRAEQDSDIDDALVNRIKRIYNERKERLEREYHNTVSPIELNIIAQRQTIEAIEGENKKSSRNSANYYEDDFYEDDIYEEPLAMLFRKGKQYDERVRIGKILKERINSGYYGYLSPELQDLILSTNVSKNNRRMGHDYGMREIGYEHGDW